MIWAFLCYIYSTNMMTMISMYEVPKLIEDALKPKIKKLHPQAAFLHLDVRFDLYTSMQDLTLIAKKAAACQDLGLLKRCLWVAEKLYSEGEHLVQEVTENVFIYGLSQSPFKPKAQSLKPKTFLSLKLKA